MAEINKRVLIADDDRIQRLIIGKLLSSNSEQETNPPINISMPFNINLFDDGKPLVKYFRKEFDLGKKIPLCILDMRMNRMNGIETAEAVRGVDPDVFIIIVSYFDDISLKELMTRLGKDVYFMNKPIKKKELLSLVTSLLITWNHQQSLYLAHKELSHAHSQLQMIIENTPVAVAMLDPQMRYIAYSKRWIKDLGIEHENLSGLCHYDIVKDIPVHWKEEHKLCLSGQTIKHEEEIFSRSDGSFEYANRKLFPLRNSGGEIQGIIIFIEFITEKIMAENARKQAEEEVKDSEAFLKAVMAAIQTSIMIMTPEQFKILDVNPYTLKMFKCGKKDIIGKDFYKLRCNEPGLHDPDNRIVEDEYALKTKNNDIIHVRRSLQQFRVKQKEYLVQSLLDITDIRKFTKKQEISIDLAKHLLNMINGRPSCYVELTKNLNLFFNAVYIPCFKEGGDHYFLKNILTGKTGAKKTLISLKDQSGHEVGCILRSIITDLEHHTILNNNPDISIEQSISLLNKEMFNTKAFAAENFFTSINAEIDHETLELRYVSAGHPRFFLISQDNISGFPGHGQTGRNFPIPVVRDMEFSAGSIRLTKGDKLIFYTDGLNDLPKMTKHEPLSYEALKLLIQEIIYQNPFIDVSDLIQSILHSIFKKIGIDKNSFSHHTFPDDITILGLEIEDNEKWNEKILSPCSINDLNKSISDLLEKIFPVLEQCRSNISKLHIHSLLAESIINAWKHGNKQSPDKSIRIRWKFNNDFELEVHDEGCGFDYHQISDPKTGDNLEKVSGRGLYIIRRFADSVRWENNGSSIIINIKKTKNLN